MGDRKLRIGLMLLAIGCAMAHWGGLEKAVQAAVKADAPPAATTTLPGYTGFSVDVTLSPKAMKKLVESKETIIVVGYLSGNPRKGALKKFVDEMGQVDLGEIKAEIAPGMSAGFGEIKFLKDAYEQTDKKPQLLINVYSGRKSSPDNLLDCGIYEGDLLPIQAKSTPISCKLIGE